MLERHLQSTDSSLLKKKKKINRVNLSMEMRQLMGKFLEISNDIKYLFKRIRRNIEEEEV